MLKQAGIFEKNEAEILKHLQDNVNKVSCKTSFSLLYLKRGKDAATQNDDQDAKSVNEDYKLKLISKQTGLARKSLC
jgi:hypothetical protein